MAVTQKTLIAGLYELRDRLLIAISRLQADDRDGAADELESACEEFRAVVDGVES